MLEERAGKKVNLRNDDLCVQLFTPYSSRCLDMLQSASMDLFHTASNVAV